MINTYSMFYYLDVSIDTTNQKIDFHDGVSNKVGVIPIGQYSPKQLADQVRNAMNNVSENTFSCTFNRTAKTYTIASLDSINFTLLISSGDNSGSSVYSIIGYSGSDTSAATTQTGSASSRVISYYPQFYVQDYEPTKHWVEKIDPSVNTTNSGIVSVVSFGSVKYSQMSLTMITDLAQGGASPVKNNSGAVQSTLDFLSVLIGKRHVEFMEDENDPTDFEIFMLESAGNGGGSKGTGFRLKEMFGQKLGNHYELKDIKFRKMD